MKKKSERKKLFSGAKEKNGYVLFGLERKVVNYLLPKVPSWLETQHLTLSTFIWSLLLIGSGFMALSNLAWIGMIILLIIFQYLTDVLDGAVGRYRETGLEKWGFYMDHLLDYIFGMSIFLTLGILTNSWIYTAIMMVVWGGVILSFILHYSITRVFSVSMAHVGPTEIRLGLIIYFAIGWWWGLSFFASTLPILLFIVSIIFIKHIWLVHQTLWQIEMFKQQKL